MFRIINDRLKDTAETRLKLTDHSTSEFKHTKELIIQTRVEYFSRNSFLIDLKLNERVL